MLRDLDIRLPEFDRVLLVDDEPDNLDVLASLLEDDWDVLTAGDGVEALELIEAHGPMDLVISDQRMPRMTGVELLSRVARTHPETVRVVLTAYSDVEPMIRAVNDGSVYRFLLKPFEAAELRQVVLEAVEHRASNAALHMLVDALFRQEQSLESTRQELEQTQQLLLAAQRVSTLGGMMSGIVHDLRGLATLLSLLLSRVRRTTDVSEVLDPAERARDHLDALVELLQQVLGVARRKPGDVQREMVSYETFFDQTVKLFAMEELGQRCPVALALDPSVRWLNVDPGHLRQGIIALLRNAARASQPGHTVDLSLRMHEGGAACLEVEDCGCGMDVPTLTRAHEPFFSGWEPPGLGLGLEVARLAAEYHGGSVELQSTKGFGTVARMYLSGVDPGGEG